MILTRATQALDTGFWIHRLSAHPQGPRLDVGFWIFDACSDPQNPAAGFWILDPRIHDLFTRGHPGSWILDSRTWSNILPRARGALDFGPQDSSAPPGGPNWICDFGFDLVCDLT